MANHLNYSDATLATELRSQLLGIQDSHRRRKSAGTITSSESAGQLERLWAAVARLEQLAQLSPLQRQFLGFIDRIEPSAKLLPVVAAETAPVRYRTGEQYTHITKALNHSCFTVADRTTYLLRINTLLEDDAPAELKAIQDQIPTPEQVAAVEAQLARGCFTDEGRAMGRRQLGEVKRAGMAALLSKFTKLADDLERQLATASTAAQAAARPQPVPVPAGAESTHPALVASPYDQARAAYIEVMRDPRILPGERDTAMSVIDDWSEAELRQKTAAVRVLLQKRPMPATAAVAA